MALVHDEYGHFEGIVTPADILDAIAGAFRSDDAAAGPEAMPEPTARGSSPAGCPPTKWRSSSISPFRQAATTRRWPASSSANLHHLPSAGESVETLGWRFEVVDMDGRRIDKVLATRLAP